MTRCVSSFEKQRSIEPVLISSFRYTEFVEIAKSFYYEYALKELSLQGICKKGSKRCMDGKREEKRSEKY